VSGAKRVGIAETPHRRQKCFGIAIFRAIGAERAERMRWCGKGIAGRMAALSRSVRFYLFKTEEDYIVEILSSALSSGLLFQYSAGRQP
jgi:hypothetical protein